MSDISELKANAMLSATYNTALQICLRIVSFIVNALVVRYVSASAFAVMNVRLHLLYSTMLLLSREAFRRSALGCTNPRKNLHKVVNLIWLGAVVCIPVCVLGGGIWIYVMETPPASIAPKYDIAVGLVLLSVFIEVCTEVPYIFSELHTWIKLKVLLEGLLQLCRCLIVALGAWLRPNEVVLIFGVAHVVAACLYCVSYYAVFYASTRHKETATKLITPTFRSLFIKFTPGKLFPAIDEDLWRVSVSFLKQGVLKEALTEGELFLMNFMTIISLHDQGIYQVVSNLGSLAARLVFRSVEAAAYVFFAQTLERGKPIREQDKNKMREVSEFVNTLLRNLILISVLIICFGFAYSRTILWLYGGWSLSESGYGLLRGQCFYVVFLATNGITEAFAFAIMSHEQLASHNYVLIVFSLVYVCATGISARSLGAFGFIIGNCINMAMRIVVSFKIMSSMFEGSGLNPFKAVFPGRRVCVVAVTTWCILAASEVYIFPTSAIGHVILGAVIGIALVTLLRHEMRDILCAAFGVADGVLAKMTNSKREKVVYYNPILDTIFCYLYK